MWWNKNQTFNDKEITVLEAWALTNIMLRPTYFLKCMEKNLPINQTLKKYIPIAKQYKLLHRDYLKEKEESAKDGEISKESESIS